MKLQGLPDSSQAPFTGVSSCAELVAEVVWAFRNTITSMQLRKDLK